MKTTLRTAASILAFAALLATSHLSAQPNTLPASGNVGIGTTSPATALHVSTQSQPGLRIDGFGVGNLLDFYTAEGAETTPARLAAGRQIGGLRAWGWDGSAYGFCGGLDFQAAEAWTAAAHGTYARIRVTPVGAIAAFEAFRITSAGNVGIGTANPTNKLEVAGTIRAKEVIVETTGWSDYVFAPEYRLAPLSEVEATIAAEGHLPGIPSAAEVATQGVSVGAMQAKLLAKMEEMTLHLIAQEKRIAKLETENAALRAK